YKSEDLTVYLLLSLFVFVASATHLSFFLFSPCGVSRPTGSPAPPALAGGTFEPMSSLCVEILFVKPLPNMNNSAGHENQTSLHSHPRRLLPHCFRCESRERENHGVG